MGRAGWGDRSVPVTLLRTDERIEEKNAYGNFQINLYFYYYGMCC